MSFSHTATDDERDQLIAIFGPTVCEVDFRDAESGRGRWESIEGFDTSGRSLRIIHGARTLHGRQLKALAAERGETVRFWLTV